MLHRKRAGAVVLAGLAVAALVTSGTPAFATNDPGRPRPPAADQEPQPDKPLDVAPPSTEDIPSGFASWEEVFALQSKLNAAADRIVAAGGDGYAGLVADPDNRDVRLYWKGEVPAAVRGAVDEGRRSVPVQVLPADYTRVELEAEARRWQDSGLAVEAYPASDGSGVVVGVAGTGTAPKLPGGERTRYVVEFERSAPDPLAAEAPATTLVDYNRQFDRAPYWGGAMYYNNGKGCTLGFPITDWWGDPGMLTAGHCGDPSDTVTTTDKSNVFGQFWDQNDAVDIAHIWVYSSVEPFVYVGGLTSSQGRRLIGAGNNHSGNYVCVNGASSGEHCAVKIYNVNGSTHTIDAQRTKKKACAVAKGDSGGPVISEQANIAVGYGIIAEGSEPVSTCGVGYNGKPLVGFHRVHYRSLIWTLGYFGATLRTN